MNERSRIEELERMGWGYKEISELLDELKSRMYEGYSRQTWNIEDDEKFKKRLNEVLRKLGCSFNVKGSVYIQEALLYLHNCKNIYHVSLTHELYPKVANKCGSTSNRVERCIRTAIMKMFDYGSPEISNIFGRCYSPDKGVVTNSEFIFGLYKYLEEDLE